jgi:hypothetical protein
MDLEDDRDAAERLEVEGDVTAVPPDTTLVAAFERRLTADHWLASSRSRPSRQP